MQEFQDSVLPFSNRIYRFAYRLAQNERDAEDLVQDTLLRAFTKFNQYQPGTSLLAWLLTITRSIFINQYRKKQRQGQQVRFEDMDVDMDRITPADISQLGGDPESYLFRNVLDADLRDALQRLSLHYLEVLILVDLEDMSYRETAEILAIPTGTVMSRLHRARKSLQADLVDLGRRRGLIKPKLRAMDGENRDTDEVANG